MKKIKIFLLGLMTVVLSACFGFNFGGVGGDNSTSSSSINQSTSTSSQVDQPYSSNESSNESSEFSSETEPFSSSSVEQIIYWIVNFYDYDFTLLYSAEVANGEPAIYPYDNPTRPNNGYNSYVFAGWDQDISCVTTNMTVVALYHEIDNTPSYTVRFFNYDDTLLYTTQARLGDSVTYPYENPTRSDDEKGHYTFKEWSADLSNITSDLDVYAVYEIHYNTYTVKFLDDDNTILCEKEVIYGEFFTYDGEWPHKEVPEDYCYTTHFDYWYGENTNTNLYDITLFENTPICMDYTFKATYKTEIKEEYQNEFRIEYDYGKIVLKDHNVGSEELIVPKGVQIIACSNFGFIKTIKVPETVEYMCPSEYETHHYFSFLQGEDIDYNNLYRIGYMFSYRDDLEMILDENNPYYHLEDGMLYSENKEIFHCSFNSEIDSFKFPDETKYSGYFSLAYEHVNNIDLNNLEYVCAYSFYCTPSNYSGGKNLKYIGEASFGYTTIESFEFTDTLEKIGYNAFVGTYLKSVYLGDLVSVDNGAFSDTSIESITVSPNNPYHATDGKCIFNKKMDTLIAYCSIDENYIFPSSVEVIATSAFRNNKNIKSVTLNEGLREICDMSLQSTAIKEINIPSSVEYIGSLALDACESLKTIVISENNQNYASIDSVVYSKDLKTLVFYPIGKEEVEFKIPDFVEIIASSAISAYGDSNLRKIIMPASIKYMHSPALSLHSIDSFIYEGTVEQLMNIENVQGGFVFCNFDCPIVCSDGVVYLEELR